MNDPFLKALVPLLEEHRDEAFAAWQTAYMRDQFTFFGVRKPRLLELLKPLIQQFPSKDEAALRKRLDLLWIQKEREFHYAALEVARKHLAIATPSLLSTFESMVRKHSWWDSVDEIAAHLVGKLAQRHKTVIPQLDAWLTDPDLWIRRTSLLYQLRWKEKTDAKKLFNSCLALCNEKDFFIRKAIGWALREYGKTAPEAVTQFLESHGKKLQPLSLREAQRLLID